MFIYVDIPKCICHPSEFDLYEYLGKYYSIYDISRELTKLFLKIYNIFYKIRYQIHEDLPKTVRRWYRYLEISYIYIYTFMKVFQIFMKILYIVINIFKYRKISYIFDNTLSILGRYYTY